MKPVAFPLAGGTFTIRWGATVTTLLMLAVLIGLGSWQMQRLRWKEDLIATMRAHSQAAPVHIESLAASDTIDYRRAIVEGVFDNRHIFYLNATSLDGQGGYHVLQPLTLRNGSHLLVDRGWIPYDRKDKADGFVRPQDTVTLTGIIHLPRHGWAQPANNLAKNDWYWPDLAALAQQAGVSRFYPAVFDADATPNAGGYPIGGQTRLDLPNNHLQYALTWYGFALVLTIIYGIQGYSRKPKA